MASQLNFSLVIEVVPDESELRGILLIDFLPKLNLSAQQSCRDVPFTGDVFCRMKVLHKHLCRVYHTFST
jgi:hypothetical protein